MDPAKLAILIFMAIALIAQVIITWVENYKPL